MKAKLLSEAEAARMLLDRYKQLGSWRAVARKDYGDLLKAGTLSSIAKSGGKYFPTRDPAYRRLLKVRPMVCRSCHQKITTPKLIKRYRRLEELNKEELLWVLDHRSEYF